jgi:hypothetical protein
MESVPATRDDNSNYSLVRYVIRGVERQVFHNVRFWMQRLFMGLEEPLTETSKFISRKCCARRQGRNYAAGIYRIT